MTRYKQFDDLNKHYANYLADKDTAPEFFKECLKVARWNVSHHTRPEFADDAAQEACITVFMDLPAMKPGQQFSWWFLRTVRNKIHDQERRAYHKAIVQLDEFDEVVDNDPSNHHHITEAAGEKNTPICDDLLAGYSMAETAERNGLTKKAVLQRFARIRKKKVENV